METFSYIILGFLLMRWTLGLVNVIFPASIKVQTPASFPFISILIPARNEAQNLPHLFSQLSSIQYPHLEIIVLNDHSEDETEALLQDYSKQNPRFRYLNGSTLPEGWLGKNWACHQLSQEAKGAYFLYLDADVNFLHECLLPRSIAAHQELGLSLMSIFPDQIMESRGEKIVVPLMHYLLLSLLPLWWIYRLPFASMAAANGQFMLFDAEVYRRFKWHERVKRVIVEDIAIMQQIKKEGLKGMTFVGSGLIKTRMYGNLSEGIEGFSKNILAGFGNSIPGLWIYLIMVVLGWGLAIFVLPWHLLLLSLVLVLSLRGMISYLANQNIWLNALLHPLQMGAICWIGMRSTLKKIRGKNEWKGRNVQL